MTDLDPRIAELFTLEGLAFERARQQLLLDEMKKMANGDEEKYRRMESMLWAQEQRLKKFKDPTARLHAVQVEFWQQVDKLRAAHDTLLYMASTDKETE